MDNNPDQVGSAISAALCGDWKQAIKINLGITKQNPNDIEALNRLGRSYLETGQKSKAITAYRQVLRNDKFNPIALKGMHQAQSHIARRVSATGFHPSPPVFLEEPGITKVVSLSRLGDPKILAALRPGDAVDILAREHCVSVVSMTHQYLGRLPDDLASRLHTLLKSGNTYEAWIKSIDIGPSKNCNPVLKIFIREKSRSAKYRNTPSFPSTEKLTYAAFTPPELVHEEKPDISLTGEETSEPESRTDLESEMEAMP